jgi:predicted RNA methylase
MNMIKHLKRKICDWYFDLHLGIKTRKIVEIMAVKDSYHYSTIPYIACFYILERLELKPTDCFFDIGSGKGRLVCCAALQQIEAVNGVEMDEALCHISRENAKALRGIRTPITIHNVCAEDFDYLHGTVYYLFNPFGAATLKAVLGRIQNSIRENPRNIRIVYVNPKFEEILAESGWLELSSRFGPDQSVQLPHKVSIFSAKISTINTEGKTH